MTKVFLEQPLAFSRSAKNKRRERSGDDILQYEVNVGGEGEEEVKQEEKREKEKNTRKRIGDEMI